MKLGRKFVETVGFKEVKMLNKFVCASFTRKNQWLKQANNYEKNLISSIFPFAIPVRMQTKERWIKKVINFENRSLQTKRHVYLQKNEAKNKWIIKFFTKFSKNLMLTKKMITHIISPLICP